MSYYMKSGNTFRIATKESMDLHEKLPAGNYVVKQDQFENFFIEHIENFEAPAKLYGDTLRNTDRIINSFWNRDKSTGVMLVGEKGSGKTLLSKNICIELAKQDVPTIVINSPWCGDKFNTLIQSIQQPCIVMFDEFEKIYDKDEQEELLTLLDGIYSSKKLFLITSNDKWRVDQHMRNRPGRIFYMVEFKGLDGDFIREYCNDNLNTKKHIETIVSIASVFSAFNFDMLKAMVEEMNRYGETPQEVLKLLNAKPEFSEESKYRVELQVKGLDVEYDKLECKEWHGNPLVKNVNVDYKVIDDDNDWDWETVRFSNNDLKQVDPTTNKFTFVNEDGNRLVLSKIKERTYHYGAF